MKKSTLVLGLLVLLGSAGAAKADEYYSGGPWVAASVYLPGMHLVFGNPYVFCRYHGRYFSWQAWNQFCRFQQERYEQLYGQNDDDDYGYYDGRDNDRGYCRHEHHDDDEDQYRQYHQDEDDD